MPPKCSICTHEKVDQIDKAITSHASFRNIAQQFGLGVHDAVYRHTVNCLSLDMNALREEQKLQRAINVYEEFEEQLAFAKRLRVAAEECLSDTEDPLKLHLVPDAREIEVTYLDYMDMQQTERGEKPKKKTAKLAELLLPVETMRNIDVGKVQIKTLDLRKFALDAIATADVCIDKFARMGGDYQKNKTNVADTAELIDRLVKFLIDKNWPREKAIEYAKAKYEGGVKQLAA